MKRGAGTLLALLLVAVIYFVRIWASSGTIDYQGQTFKTAKRYLSYESYKDDPNNLDTNELERIEKVMIEASVYASRASGWFGKACCDCRKTATAAIAKANAKPQTTVILLESSIAEKVIEFTR